jgi:hypothetical protein
MIKSKKTVTVEISIKKQASISSLVYLVSFNRDLKNKNDQNISAQKTNQ